MLKVEESEIEKTISFFTENILDENIHKYFFTDNNTYLEKVEYLYRFYCNFHFNNLYKSDDGTAIVICHPPTKKLITPTLKDAYSISYAAKVGMKEIVRLISYQIWLKNFKSTILQKDHYYLDSFAVKDNIITTARVNDILSSIMNKAKAEDINVFFEVYDVKLANEFSKHGFRIAKEAILPNSNIKAYCLVF